MNFKKIALIVLFLAVTFGAGYLLYRVFFAPPPAPEAAPEAAPGVPVTGLPTAVPGRPAAPGVPPTVPVGLPPAPAVSPVAVGGYTQTVPVIEQTALSPVVASNGALSFYNRDTGKFSRRLPDGTIRDLSDKTFPSAENVVWSPESDRAIIEFPDDSKVIFDFNAQKQVTLPKHWEDFSFSGDGKMIAAKSMSLDENNRWLITVNADGSEAKLIEPLGENADKVIVNVSPDNSVVAFSQTGDAAGFDTREVYLIGQNDENFKSLRVEGFGFKPLWSPSGENIIYSAASGGDNYRPSVWFVNAKGQGIGQNRTNLEVNTWADKCAFADETTVFCAVPDNLPRGAGLQREIAAGIPDSIVKIDLKTGSKTVIGRPEQDTSISTVAVTPDGGKLFFTDDGGFLQEMKLR